MACQSGPVCSGSSYASGDCSKLNCIAACSQCSSACGDTCTGRCRASCGYDCGAGCSGTCSGRCDDSCDGCSGTCLSSCTGSCTDSCTGSCTGSCANSCLGSCTNGCINGCSTTSFNQAYTNLVLNDIILDEDITTIVDWIKREGSLKGVAMASPEVAIGESVPVLYQSFNSIMANLQAMGQSLSYTPITGNDIKKASVQEYIDKAKMIYEAMTA